MNPERMEELLRKTPSPKAPSDLLQKLAAEIRLPRPDTNETTNWNRPPSWTRRWLPAFSFAAIFLACLVAIAMQSNVLSELQNQNGKLQAALPNLGQLRAQNAEYQKLAAENGELDRLRKDNAELLKLRGEVAQLQSQLQDADSIRAANERLTARASQAEAAGSGDFFADEKARAERIQCVNNLKQIGLAGRLWSGDNHDVYPTNFICMTNELGTWKILQCPSDKSHSVTNWAQVEAGNISYIMDSPGILEGGPEYSPNIVFVECTVHHNICLIDGSVQMLSDKGYRLVKTIDGKKVLTPPQ